MRTDIDDHSDDPTDFSGPEYRRRLQQAVSEYAALEIEAWRLRHAEEQHPAGADQLGAIHHS